MAQERQSILARGLGMKSADHFQATLYYIVFTSKRCKRDLIAVYRERGDKIHGRFVESENDPTQVGSRWTGSKADISSRSKPQPPGRSWFNFTMNPDIIYQEPPKFGSSLSSRIAI